MKSVAVYCGSSAGANPAYVAQAQALGAALVAQGLTLVYGGGRVGLWAPSPTRCWLPGAT